MIYFRKFSCQFQLFCICLKNIYFFIAYGHLICQQLHQLGNINWFCVMEVSPFTDLCKLPLSKLFHHSAHPGCSHQHRPSEAVLLCSHHQPQQLRQDGYPCPQRSLPQLKSEIQFFLALSLLVCCWSLGLGTGTTAPGLYSTGLVSVYLVSTWGYAVLGTEGKESESCTAQDRD